MDLVSQQECKSECVLKPCETTGLGILKDKHLWFYSIIVAVVAIIVAIIISKGVTTPAYQNLSKPSWNPNSTTFIILWVLIYAFVTYSWFIVDRISDCCGYSRTSVNILFGLNILLSVVWAYLYFNSVNLGASLTIIIILLVLTGYMVWFVSKINRIATFLFILYFVWLLIVTYLNYSVYNLNHSEEHSPRISV